MRHWFPGPLGTVVPGVVTLAVVGAATACTADDAVHAAAAAAPGSPAIVATAAPGAAAQVTSPTPLDDLLHDQGNPVTLPDGRTMWIFADTADVTGPWMFQTSSAGFSEQGAPDRVTFTVDAEGRPAEFLPRTEAEMPTDHTAYLGLWPMGAATLPDGRVIVSYSTYDVNLSPVEFRFVASGLFEYRYPGADQLAHPVAARRIADDLWGKEDGPVNSPVYADGFLYFLNCGLGGCFSVRGTVGRLADRSTYEWWTGSGWSGDKAQRRPMSFGGTDQPGRSASLQWVPALGAYALSDTVLGAPDTTGLVWLAARPQGPWSAPARFPMANCGTRSCYLPIVHPQSSTASSLRVAYSSGGTLGPTIWSMDVPVKATVPQRSSTYAAPVPVADTTTGVGVPAAGALQPGRWLQVSVVRPDQPSSLATVTVDVQVTGATGAGRVRVSPSGSFRPGTAVAYTADAPGHAVLTLPVGPNGRLAITNEGQPVQVKVHLLGWTTAA